MFKYYSRQSKSQTQYWFYILLNTVYKILCYSESERELQRVAKASVGMWFERMTDGNNCSGSGSKILRI